MQKKEEIYKTIAEHFNLLVRPDNETIEKYQWIEDKSDNIANDELLATFLIWFFNHPHDGFSKRVSDSVQKLVLYEPDLMIPILINEISINEPNVSSVKCSLILKNIANEVNQIQFGIF